MFAIITSMGMPSGSCDLLKFWEISANISETGGNEIQFGVVLMNCLLVESKGWVAERSVKTVALDYKVLWHE